MRVRDRIATGAKVAMIAKDGIGHLQMQDDLQSMYDQGWSIAAVDERFIYMHKGVVQSINGRAL